MGGGGGAGQQGEAGLLGRKVPAPAPTGSGERLENTLEAMEK